MFAPHKSAAVRLLLGIALSTTLLLPASGLAATDPREIPPPPPTLPTETTIQCPADGAITVPSFSNPTPYKSGFQYGCHFFENRVFYAKTIPPPMPETLLFSTVFDFINTSVPDRESLICTVGRADKEFSFSGGDRNAWTSGCGSGLDQSEQVYSTNSSGHPPLTLNDNNIKNGCHEAAARNTQAASVGQKAEFENGCIKGYYAWVNREISGEVSAQISTIKFSVCTGGTTFFNNGCLAGPDLAEAAYDALLPATAGPSATIVSFVENPEIQKCGFNQGMTDIFGENKQNYKDGYYQGCYNGYFQGLNNSGAACEYYASSRGYKQGAYNTGFGSGCGAGYSAGARERSLCMTNNKPVDPLPSKCQGAAAGPTGPTSPTITNHGGIVPDCDPALPPSDPKGCGINKAVELIKNIMKYLFFIVLPIGALVICWGGFQIMTAAGSQEKVSSGIGSIKLAVIGIAIMLASYFIVQAVFLALGVSSSFTPSGL